MKSSLLACASALAVWAGMAVLCFQSSSQRRRLALRELSGSEPLRYFAAASALIGLSLAAAVAADGVQFGLLLWLCQAGMLGLALICALPFARSAVEASARAAAVSVPLLLAAAGWA